MSAIYELVEGWTARLDWQLLADGVAPDLTGATVELLLRTRTGTLIDTVGDVELVIPASAIVGYNPDPTDIVAANSPLTARWKVTKDTKVTYFPSGDRDKWIIDAP